MSIAIKVEGIAKRFSRMPARNKGNYIKAMFKDVFGLNSSTYMGESEFLALDDVDFSVNSGESIALVGRNGSGKSTLLKVLNGLLRPDSGRVVINGSVQAIINLGAGFDPNVSGRENVVNAISLSGRKQEEIPAITKKIIEFSELNEFIDSPVSTYSSGMYARLGFAVATHVDADIILIDEILSVGDISFQNKCFTHMQQLRAAGVTMLLVSHSEAQVSQFCDKAIWLDKGKVKRIGKASEILQEYNRFITNLESNKDKTLNVIPKNKVFDAQDNNETQQVKSSIFGALYPAKENSIQEVKFTIVTNQSKSANIIPVNAKVAFIYQFVLLRKVEKLNVSINICKEDGLLITTISTLNGDLLENSSNGLIRAKIEIEDLCLAPGKYFVVMPIHEGHSYLYRNIVASFRVFAEEQLCWGIVNYDVNYKIERIQIGE